MKSALMTVSRTPNYLPETIASYFQSGTTGKLALIAGGQDQEYLKPYINDQRIEIVSAHNYDFLSDWPLRRKACWTYWRAIEWGYGNDDLLIIEDDIKFSNNWQARLTQCLAAAKKNVGDFLMSLYVPDSNERGNVPFTFALDGYKAGELYVPYDPAEFYGSQAVVFSAGAIKKFHKAATMAMEGVTDTPTDYTIRDFCRTELPLLATCPCLAQHTGNVTTGLAGRTHTSSSFVEEV